MNTQHEKKHFRQGMQWFKVVSWMSIRMAYKIIDCAYGKVRLLACPHGSVNLVTCAHGCVR
jgi:hypothetical protein